MLWQRILSAVVLIPIVILLVGWHPISCTLLVLLAAGLMLHEFAGFSKLAGSSLPVLPFLVSCLLVSIPETQSLGIGASVLLATIQPLLRRQPEGCYQTAGLWVLGAIYIAWCFGYHLIALRRMPHGVMLIALLVAIIWMTDILAFTVGKLLGRHKLIPSISPKKTVEGSVGGTLGGILAGMLVWHFGLSDVLTWLHVLVLATLLSAVAQVSDLIESAIKRDVNIKDSGTLIPGHGGMLDRCDSLILAAPTMYYYVHYVLG